MMSNWNIVCNTNIHYILKYGYDILMNNIYTQKLDSLKTLCIDAAYERPVCYRKLVIIFVCGSTYNASIGYTKLNTMITTTT